MENRSIPSLLAVTGFMCVALGFYILVQEWRQDTESPALVEPASYAKPSTGRTNPVTSKVVSVPSKVMWFDTGIDIPKGAPVRIEYQTGEWTNVVGTNFCDGTGKQYDKRHHLILPSSHLAALIGNYCISNYTIPLWTRRAREPERGVLNLIVC